MATKLVVLLFVSCVLTQSCCTAKEVCIVPDGDSPKPPSCTTASTIDQFCGSGVKDNTVATFSDGTHKLGTVCEVVLVKNITFRAGNKSKVTVKCSPQNDASFKFLNVSMLKLSGIEFIGCGATSTPTSSYVSALLFANGSGVTVTNVNVSDSKYFGIFIHNVAGNVSMDSFQITNASSNLIRYSTDVTEDIELTMANCLIMDGRLPTDPLSGGITLLAGNPKLRIEIANSSFIRNMGLVGGNMLLYYTDFASVVILNSAFVSGLALADGGGMSVSFELHSTGSTNEFEFLNIVNSNFTNNVALSGGGLSIIWDNLVQYEGYAYVKISDTLFYGNSLAQSPVLNTQARGGLAMLIYSNDYFSTRLPTFFNVSLSKCVFTNHNPQTHDQSSSVIFATSIPYLGMDNIVIEFNGCTAVMAISCAFVFSGSSMISNNAASRGGGFQLVDSKINVMPHTNITITNNFAQHYGGGLIIDNSYSCLVGSQCFLQVEDSNLDFVDTMSFYVGNNSALEGGEDVFGVVVHCFDVQNAAHSVWRKPPTNSLLKLSSLSSNPQLVCIGTPQEEISSTYTFESKSCPAGDCSSECLGELCNIDHSVVLYPGEKVTLPIRVAGQSEGALAGTVSAVAEQVVITDLEKTQVVGFSGSNITYTMYSAQSSNKQALLNLEPVDYTQCFDSAIYKPTNIHITFLDCPFGFNNTENDLGAYECQCNLDFTATVDCSIESQTITKELFSWVGVLEHDNASHLAASVYCPLDYCNASFQHVKSLPDRLDQDEQCQYNRTGVLCGSCQEGWSLVLGSSECCENCSSAWLLLIIPFALAGILLVVVIHLLNLTVTMGTICGLIFYANVLQDYSTDILSSKHHHIPGLTPILQVFLSWFNLDLGISTCFYGGMDAFGKTMLLFVFPVYIWLISAIIIILSDRFVSFTNLIGENATKILSTLILLSYSKMLRVSFIIFNQRSIDFETGSSNRWSVDGNIPYLDPPRHLPLFLIALLVVALLVPFTFNLLFIKQVSTLPNYSRAFSWIDKLKPFYDTFTGPYKDKARFWTGLLLLVRMFLLVMHSLDFKDNSILYCIIVAASLLLSAIVVCLKGVYNKHGLSILEYFFILNMGLLFLVNLYGEECSGKSVCLVSVVSHLLVCLAFFAFLGIVGYHVLLKFARLGWLRRFQFRHQNVDEEIDSVDYRGLREYDDEPAKEMTESNTLPPPTY